MSDNNNRINEDLILVEMKFGSHLYGLNTENSDEDYVGIFLPSLEDILLGRGKQTINLSTSSSSQKNSSEDVDRTFYSLHAFIQGLINGNTTVLDMIHAPKSAIIKSSPIWEAIVSHRHLAYTKTMKSFVGYCRTQASKYGIKGDRLRAVNTVQEFLKDADPNLLMEDVWDKLPTGEYLSFVDIDSESAGTQHYYEVCNRKFQNTAKIEYVMERLDNIAESYGHRARLARDSNGMDFKAISHALRVAYQARAIFKNGGFEYPLEETPFIMKAKLGELDFETEISPVLDDLMKEIEELSKKSDYPEKADAEFWENFLIDIYYELLESAFSQRLMNP
jgi:hypothetical protein